MSETVNNILANADYFLLMMIRIGALVYTSPVFGRVLIPGRVKICLILAVGYFCFTAMPPASGYVIEYSSLIGFLLIIVSEMIIGFAMAYITNVFFALTFVAGHSIDLQIGFGMVNVYDIQNQTQAPITGNILNMTLLLVFFLMDGQLKLISALFATFDRMPVGVPLFSPNAGYAALEAFVRMFMLGIMVALPVIASGLMIEICFGALMRAVPQIHMMIVGVPLKLLIGFIILAAIIPVYISFSPALFDEMFIWLDNMFASLLES
jgi:flagellar biosynthetic protein FliR